MEKGPRSGLRAIVVGGGVGGLTAAIALQQAGIDVSVFERSADARLTAGRWALAMWSNAMRLLQQLGLADAVLATAPETEKLVFESWRGDPIAVWPVGDLGRELRAPSCGISPEALLTVLTDALAGGVIERSAECVSLTQDAGGVTVKLADGREEHGDLLVGADGLRSMVRDELVGPAPPRYAGYWVWQSIIDFDDDVQAPLGIDQLLWGRGARFAFHHVERDRLFWQVIINTPEAGDGVRSGRREQLVKRFEGWRDPVQAVIAQTPEAEIRGLPIYDREPTKRWSVGRATLLGDAAHPMTNNLGQGACMAIEDAVVLARCVSDAPGDIAGALHRYEQARIERTAVMVKLARRIGELGTWKNPLAAAGRDRVMGVLLGGPIRKSHFKLMAYEV
jgi:2-polyprenyl-6-methoxyphenol hydroxylase-like FAD-dependent oxidoreductase